MWKREIFKRGLGGGGYVYKSSRLSITLWTASAILWGQPIAVQFELCTSVQSAPRTVSCYFKRSCSSLHCLHFCHRRKSSNYKSQVPTCFEVSKFFQICNKLFCLISYLLFTNIKYSSLDLSVPYNVL